MSAQHAVGPSGERWWVSKIDLSNGVVLYDYDDMVDVRHECDGDQWLHKMILRENIEGPVYWCSYCGYTTDEGMSMAIRLYEVAI
jgi:hypothetical protein